MKIKIALLSILPFLISAPVLAEVRALQFQNKKFLNQKSCSATGAKADRIVVWDMAFAAPGESGELDCYLVYMVTALTHDASADYVRHGAKAEWRRWGDLRCPSTILFLRSAFGRRISLG